MTQDNLNKIIEKIVATNKIAESELKQKIQEKMDSLGSLISEEGAAHIIANELGVKMGSAPSSEVKLKEINPTMRNLTVLVKVLKKYEIRTFGDDGKVGSLFVGDDTGFSRLTFWNDKTKYLEGINEGDVILIQNAYVKENNGRSEIHMGNSSHCIVNPEGRTVEVKQKQTLDQETQEKKLKDITDEDTFISITATIVQVYDPRFFESCPQCNKRMKEEDGVFTCAEHGRQTPKYNYVMNLFLDDGTDNMRATLWKEQINLLLGKTEEEIIKLKDDQNQLEETKTDLLGRIIRAKARVKVNETYNNKELVLYQIEIDPNPQVSNEEVKNNASETKSNDSKDEKPSEQIETNNMTEELFDENDEELLSIEDLEEDL